MRVVLPFLFVLSALYTDKLNAQQCSPPQNVYMYVDIYMNNAYISWSPPISSCTVLYYEVEFASSPFTPGLGQGTFVSNVYDTNYYIPYSYVAYAWVRAICDCEGGGGSGDGIADTEGAWAAASVGYAPPPYTPDLGITCFGCPEEAVMPAYNCGNYYNNLLFFGMYAIYTDQALECTANPQHIIWRWFTAPAGGEVEVHLGLAYGYSNDMGFEILSGSCEGEVFTCVANASDTEPNIISGLVPGTTYFIGVWFNDYPYDESTVSEVALDICTPPLPCYAPTAISASQITNETALISWSANTESSWTLEYGESGFTQGTGTVITVNGMSSSTLNELSASTLYDVYVSAECGTDGSSLTNGPYTFSTLANMWVTAELPEVNKFCCDDPLYPEGFPLFSYCSLQPLSHVDEIIGEGCDYQIIRTITAQDTCGNSLNYVVTINIADNMIPGGCSEEFTIPQNSQGKAVATDGEWAILEGGNADLVYKLVDGVWTSHSTINIGSTNQVVLEMSPEKLVAGNKIYQVVDDAWVLEQELISSFGDNFSTASSIYNNNVALEMNGRIFIFEHDGNTWIETAFFEHNCGALDITDDVLLCGGNYTSHIGKVYRKTENGWALEQELSAIAGSTGIEVGYDVSIDGNLAAIGTRYFGGIHTYSFNGEAWNEVAFLTNPYLYTNTGYYSNMGQTIDIEGNLLVAGDYMNQANGPFSGSIVVFEWLCDQWSPQRNIVPKNGGINQRFGGSIDLSNGRLISGVETTQWIGGYNYNSLGKYWFYDHLEFVNTGLTINAAEDALLICGSEIPLPEYTIGNQWCDDYEVSIEESGEGNCVSPLMRTYSIIDVNGNTASDTQTISFIDINPPLLIMAPSDLTLDCGSEIIMEEPTFMDDCSTELSIAFEETTEGGSCETIVTRTWIATDLCNNSSSFTQYITLTDTSPPVIECPLDQTATFILDEEVFYCPNYIEDLAATDNCSGIALITQSISDIQPLEPGTYEIVMTSADECGNESTCTFNLEVVGVVGIEEQGLEAIHIYPNPASDFITVSASTTKKREVLIYNSTGQLVRNSSFNSAQINLPVFDLAKGVYSLQVLDSDGMRVFSFVRE
jgi:hypothetical protein